MRNEKKYKLLLIALIATILLLISIFLIYISYYNLNPTHKASTNYYALSFGVCTWVGFIISLVNLMTTFNNI